MENTFKIEIEKNMCPKLKKELSQILEDFISLINNSSDLSFFLEEK